MNAYRVTIIHDACTTHDVEAESEQAAVHHAMNDAGVTLCHYCSHTIEVGDPIRAACVQNLDNGESNMDADPAFEVVQLRARVAELVAALDEAQQDAARYQWLRSRVPGGTYRIMGVIYGESGCGVDAAIDAARAGDAA